MHGGDMASSEELLRTVLDATPSLIFVKDSEGRYYLVNKAIQKLFGLPAEEIIGKTDLDFIVDDEERAHFQSDDKEVLQTGESKFIAEEQCTHPDGSVSWYQTTKIPITIDGKNGYVLGTSEDITARKNAEEALRKSEELFRGFAVASTHGFGMGKIGGPTIFGNSVLLRMVGESAKSFAKKTFYDYYLPDDVIRLRDEILPAVLDTGQWVGEIPLLSSKGTLTETEQNIFLIRDESGKPGTLGNIITDITERKRYAEEINLRNKELEEFTYFVSHDLQEPLRRIRIFSQKVERSIGDKLSETQQRHFGYISSGTSRMSKLIKDLLELSRVGTSDVQKQTCDLTTMAREARNDLGPIVRNTGARIRISRLPTVVGFCSQIAQLFGNLFSNALKYRSDSRIPRVRVYYEVTDKERRVCVADNGIGIEERHIDQVFQPFTRLCVDNKVSGSGVGLTICQRIIDRHGWKIGVESTPGKGSVFWFSIGESHGS
jgi:PAS domain S-box-containing protein